jgi:secreted PhoX family phosphatase
MKIPWFTYLIILLVFGGMLGAGYMYFDYTQKQISTLSQDLGTVKAENKLQDEAIDSVKKANIDMKRIAEVISTLQYEAQKAVTDLERKFTKMTLEGQRDLGRLAEARPDSIERIINEGTDNVFRCMEISTGSVLTEEEKKEYDDTGKISDCPGVVIPS